MRTPSRGNFFVLTLILTQFFLIALLIAATLIFGNIMADVSEAVLIIVSQALCFLLPSIIYLVIKKQKASEILRFKRVSLKNMSLIFFIMLLAQPVIMLVSAAALFIFPDITSESFGEIAANNSLPVLILTLAVTPAVCEEAAFRGVVYNEYKDMPLRTAAIMNGFLFGAIHLNGLQFSYAFICGFIFVYFVYYTGSIFSSMFAHFIMNAITGFSLFFYTEFYPEYLERYKEIPTLDEKVEAFIVSGVLFLVTFPFFFLLFRYFVNSNKERLALLESGVSDESGEEDMYYEEEPVKKRVLSPSLVIIIVIFGINLIWNQLLSMFPQISG